LGTFSGLVREIGVVHGRSMLRPYGKPKFKRPVG
jgi:hypothetical protein